MAPALIVVAVLFFLMSLYFLYARYRFSPAGGNVQAQVQDLVLAHLDWDGQGKALDVGCGNAPLTIKLAHQYPNAQVAFIPTALKLPFMVGTIGVLYGEK